MLITETASTHLTPVGTAALRKAHRWWQMAKNGHTLSFHLYRSQSRWVRRTWAAQDVPELCFEVDTVRGAAARKRHQIEAKHWKGCGKW